MLLGPVMLATEKIQHDGVWKRFLRYRRDPSQAGTLRETERKSLEDIRAAWWSAHPKNPQNQQQ